MGKKKKKGSLADRADRHALYEASVQDVDTEIRFLKRIYRTKRNMAPLSLREDFCGTALLASSWVAGARERKAWGIDLDPEVLDWARTQRVPYLKAGAERLKLIEGDVRAVKTPKVDVLAALNFSYFCFMDRDAMRSYFQTAVDMIVQGRTDLIALAGEDPVDHAIPLFVKRLGIVIVCIDLFGVV